MVIDLSFHWFDTKAWVLSSKKNYCPLLVVLRVLRTRFDDPTLLFLEDSLAVTSLWTALELWAIIDVFKSMLWINWRLLTIIMCQFRSSHASNLHWHAIRSSWIKNLLMWLEYLSIYYSSWMWTLIFSSWMWLWNTLLVTNLWRANFTRSGCYGTLALLNFTLAWFWNLPRSKLLKWWCILL